MNTIYMAVIFATTKTPALIIGAYDSKLRAQREFEQYLQARHKLTKEDWGTFVEYKSKGRVIGQVFLMAVNSLEEVLT